MMMTQEDYNQCGEGHVPGRSGWWILFTLRESTTRKELATSHATMQQELPESIRKSEGMRMMDIDKVRQAGRVVQRSTMERIRAHVRQPWMHHA